METRLQHLFQEDGECSSCGTIDEHGNRTDVDASKTNKSLNKKGRRRRKRGKVKRERLNSSNSNGDSESQRDASCGKSNNGNKPDRTEKVLNIPKTNMNVQTSKGNNQRKSWLDDFESMRVVEQPNAPLGSSKKCVAYKRSNISLKKQKNSNMSWLDCDTIESCDTSSDISDSEQPTALPPPPPVVDVANTFSHNLDKYKMRYSPRYQFRKLSERPASRNDPEQQAWNNEKKVVKKDLASRIGTNVNILHQNASNKQKDKYDGTKRSRRKTEPFDFAKQAEGNIGEALNSQTSTEPGQFTNAWDIPTGLCNFMADANDNVTKDLDGRNLLSGSISGKGLFVPFENIDERVFKEDSFGKIFKEDYCDDSDDLQSNTSYDSDNARSESDDEDRNCNNVFGALPPEPQLGNVEYKLKLVNPTKQRFEHLVTQMKWRLREGQGEALYEIGVRDCGRVRGLAPAEMRASLRTLRKMATRLGAECTLLGHRQLPDSKRTLVEVLVRKIPDDQHNIEVRVAVMGSNDAGKSTLVGVLTQGELDNGRGSARLNMFRHLHEVKTGRTSSVSHEILGFDSQGRPINYAYSELMTSEEINERSSKLISFIDLAGHRKYLKTTVQGLTGYSPHYAMLVVSATAGITQMTLEHLALVVALDLPFFVVVTKIDATSPDQVIKQLELDLKTIGCRKVPLSVTSMDDAVTAGSSAPSRLAVPVLPVSSLTGKGLDVLRWFLFLAPPVTIPDKMEQEPTEFQVDEIFKMSDANGPVVGGLLKKGVLTERTKLLIGPLDTGDFVPISVNSLHRNKAPCRIVRAGQAASLGLSWLPPGLRQGMFLLAIPDNYKLQKDFQNNIAQILCKLNKKGKSSDATHTSNKSPKFSKKNKRDDPASPNEDQITPNSNEDHNVTRLSLSKYSDRFVTDPNNFTNEMVDEGDVKENNSSNEDSSPERKAKTFHFPKIDEHFLDDAALKEDSEDPRGCYFFQATVSLLNNSAALSPGCQSTVHIGNIRQTAVVEGIFSSDNLLRANEQTSVVFRFMRHPEYVRTGVRILFREALHTKGIGRVTQTFPHKLTADGLCCDKHTQEAIDPKPLIVDAVD